MFELNKILNFGKAKLLLDQKLVLATIVRTEGSTYRKKGTQMMVTEDLTYEGAISGGCVESEVVRQAVNLFQGKPGLTFEYDGRYKLGCNGKLFILLELLDPSQFKDLIKTVEQCERDRKSLYLGWSNDGTNYHSYYRFDDTLIRMGSEASDKDPSTNNEEIEIRPQSQLVIIGSEYDALLLAKFAVPAGFKTFMIAKDIRPANYNFEILNIEPEELGEKLTIDTITAVVVMTHSYSRDLRFMKQLIKAKMGYLGILGPADRRDKVLSDLIELEGFDLLNIPDNIYAPIGLDIGATLPEEISIAILAEIVSVFRHGNAQHLKDRVGSIHLEP